MKNIRVLIVVALFTAPLVLFQGCATEKAIKVEKSLHQSKLAYYNDSFDRLRDDIWEKAAKLYKEEQSSNFKAADITIENGQLKIMTKTGYFSKGALSSKYAIKGDFDIQVDCHIDFLDAEDMDQFFSFLVLERGKEFEDFETVQIQFMKAKGPSMRSRKSMGSPGGMMLSFCRKQNRPFVGTRQEMDSFRGSLRIVRQGNKASTYHKREGKTEWEKMYTFRFTKNDVGCGFMLQNFVRKRESITARSTFQARLDNFRINAAQEIIEDEI